MVGSENLGRGGLREGAVGVKLVIVHFLDFFRFTVNLLLKLFICVL